MNKNIFDFSESQWLQALYQQAPIALGIYMGKNYVIEFVNPMMCEIWDRNIEEVIDKPLFEALPEVASQGYEEILDEVFITGKPFEGTGLPAVLKRGDKVQVIYVNIMYKPFLNPAGKVIGIVQTATEVTDLILAKMKTERNQEILNLALQSGKIGTWYVDLVTGHAERSNEYDKIFGHDTPLEEWNVESLFNYVVPEDLPLARKVYDEGVKNGTLSCEVNIKWPDNSIHRINIKGETTYNLKNKPISIAGVVMDVTEQKQVEEKERQLAVEHAARKEAERQTQKLEQLLMEAPALICTLSGPEHVYNFVNPLYQQQLFPGRRLKGKKISEAIFELEGQPFIDMLDSVYTTGKSFIGNEVPLQLDRHNTGKLETAYFNFVYQAQRDVDGEITGILVFAFEVTEQIKARRLVEESKRHLQLALDAGKMGTWHFDFTQDISVHSLEHDLIFGYDGPAPHWGFKYFIQHVVPEERYRVKEQFKSVGETYELSFETRIHTVNKKLKWIAVKGKSLFENEKPVGMAGIIMDISEGKEAEKKLNVLTEKLAKSNQELKLANNEITESLNKLSDANNQLKLINADLDNFIYAASHDLKAPISNIEGLMEMLNRRLPVEIVESENIKKILIAIITSVERFKKTIIELTDIAKLQKQVEDVSTLNIREIINEVILDLETVINEAGAEVEVKFNECLEIEFSYKSLKSVVHNIISNAIKYRSQDRVPRVNLTCTTEKEGFICLTISDNGLGIKQKDLGKIFGIYKRLHTHVEGTGIGLYLVKRIIDNAGGEIEVESEENIGTTFKVFFPVSNVRSFGSH